MVAEYWIRYSPARGRLVNYVIRSEFTLCDENIVRQVGTPAISRFEVARMAAGLAGAVFVPLTPSKMRRKLSAFNGQSNLQRSKSAAVTFNN